MNPIVILGPTATGKTDLALLVARELGGRVIGADSIQVYRGLDIGSSKPSPGARRAVRHHMIDVADPAEPFSAGRFARMASAAIDACRRDGSVPVVAGGTGLYIRALLQGIASMPPRDQALRDRLYARARDGAPGALHEELAALDPAAASRIGRNDLQRIVRALEVLALTGRPLSEHIAQEAFSPGRVPALKIGLEMERTALYERIDNRVDAMFERGLVGEVHDLLSSGLSPEVNALKALGYREVLAHLRGEMNREQTIELVKRNTRRYARRQVLWFRREPDVRWFQVDGGSARLEEVAAEVVALHAQPRDDADSSGVDQDGH